MVKGFDSPLVEAMHEANSIKPLYRGVGKDDPESVVVIHQAEERVAKALFFSRGPRHTITLCGCHKK